jgi:hypothetical protein
MWMSRGARRKAAADARKPNSVRLRSAPRGAELWRDDHSSSPIITDGIEQPTRRRRTGRPLAPPCGRTSPPYLALLRAGFCLPLVLPRARCALTAPFHHCLPCGVSCVFSVPLVLRVAPTGRYPAHCPAEFGLSSHLHAFALRPAIVWTSTAVQRSCHSFGFPRFHRFPRFPGFGFRGSAGSVGSVDSEVRFTGFQQQNRGTEWNFGNPEREPWAPPGTEGTMGTLTTRHSPAR